MIDSTGKKIGEDSNKSDKAFELAEIKFFLKGFRNDKTDGKAYSVAKTIREYLKSGGSDEDIVPLISELEEYVESTESEDFLWQLVYIQREIATNTRNYLYNPALCAECKYRAAQYFDKICEVAPTLHNNCCRVIEYVLASLGFESAKQNEKILPLLEKAEEQFLQIPKTDSEVYYTAGRLLYSELRIKLTFESAEQEFEVIQKTAHYAVKLYKARPLNANLDRALYHYCDYCKNKFFSFADEEQNLIELIEIAEKTDNKSTTLKRRLLTLKEILQRFRPNTQ